jgi:hypothetical protein
MFAKGECYSLFFMPVRFRTVFHIGAMSEDKLSSNVPVIYSIRKTVLLITIQTKPW